MFLLFFVRLAETYQCLLWITTATARRLRTAVSSDLYEKEDTLSAGIREKINFPLVPNNSWFSVSETTFSLNIFSIFFNNIILFILLLQFSLYAVTTNTDNIQHSIIFHTNTTKNKQTNKNYVIHLSLLPQKQKSPNMTAVELNWLNDTVISNPRFKIRVEINYINNVKRAFCDVNICESEEIEFNFRIQRR